MLLVLIVFFGSPFLSCFGFPNQTSSDTDKNRGELVLLPNFHSETLSNDRTIRVWLPPGYGTDKKRRYPVFYFHDGQNIFTNGPSFIPNQSWRADATALALIQSKKIPAMILVGIDNTGGGRVKEYTTSEDPTYKGGGGDAYGKMLVEELKPYIDSHYRTLKDAKNTGLGGASLGGLISLHLGLNYPKVFGKLAVMSPSIWWNKEAILHEIEGMTKKPKLKIWLDVGLKEGYEMVNPTQKMRAQFILKGWKEETDLKYAEGAEAGHNEKAWAERLPEAMTFLFGAG